MCLWESGSGDGTCCKGGEILSDGDRIDSADVSFYRDVEWTMALGNGDAGDVAASLRKMYVIISFLCPKPPYFGQIFEKCGI